MLNRFSSMPNEAEPVAAPPRFASESLTPGISPHRLEREVQRQLLAEPHLKFSSLVVRRLENGVCLQGVLEADADAPDVVSLVQRIAGVDQVLNHLLVASNCDRPRKG